MTEVQISLLAITRALRDVVIPSIGVEQSRAREQAVLAAEYLEFLAKRVDMLHDRLRYELTRHTAIARDVRRVLVDHDGRVAELDEILSAAEHGLATGGASAADLSRLLSEVKAGVARTARDTRVGDTGLKEVHRAIVQAGPELINFERAWYEPLGLDPDTDESDDLESMLGVAGQHSSIVASAKDHP